MVAACIIQLDIQEGGSLTELLFQSMTDLNITSLILYFCFFQLLKFALRQYNDHFTATREKLCCWIPAGLFSCFMLLGYSYYSSNSWDLVFGSTLQLIKSGIAFTGYLLLFWSSIVCLFHYMDQKNIKGKKSPDRTVRGICGRYFDCLEKRPFRTAFFTLFVVYLPYMIYSFPGIVSTDTRTQLQEAYLALSGNGSLRNHHPVLHTLLLRFGTWLGECFFSSANTGLFLVALAQSLLLFAAIAWMIRLLTEKNISNKIICLVMLYYVVSPRIRNYVFLLAKDAWFASFLLIYIVQLYRLLTDSMGSSKEKRKHLGLLFLSMAGIFFFRQDGIYLLTLSCLAVLLTCRNHRKLMGCLLTGAIAFSFLYSQILLPACQVRPTNTREMLSIPFQQTARYIHDAGEDVTDEEKEAIASILDYDHLAEKYNPNLSDPVKATFDKDADPSALAAYFKVWFQMLWKHPDIYVQATMNNLYGYFYPGGYTTKIYSYEESAERMEKLNNDLDGFGTDFGYPQRFQSLRNGLELLREMIFQLPVLSALNLSAFYIWVLILWLFYCLKGKRKQDLLTTWPLLIVLLICMAGPAYGWYFRYMYSITICLPAVILPGWSDSLTHI